MATEARDYLPPLLDDELEELWQVGLAPRLFPPGKVQEAVAAIPRLVAEVRRLRGAAYRLQFHHAIQGLPCATCAEYGLRAHRDE